MAALDPKKRQLFVVWRVRNNASDKVICKEVFVSHDLNLIDCPMQAFGSGATEKKKTRRRLLLLIFGTIYLFIVDHLASVFSLP